MTLNMCHMLWDMPNFHQMLIRLSYPGHVLLTVTFLLQIHHHTVTPLP